MELRVFDKTIEPLGAIDELASLLWHIKYFDVGTFSLLAPITDNNSKLLIEGNVIVKHDGKQEVTDANGGIWRRAAQITYVHITKDENGLEQIEAQGFTLSRWLGKRCIYRRKAGSYRRKRRHLAQGGTDYLRAYYERRERVRADRGAGLYIEPLAGETLHIPADSGDSHKPEFNKYYGNEKLRQRGSREKAV